jgi:hypothetical protein
MLEGRILLPPLFLPNDHSGLFVSEESFITRRFHSIDVGLSAVIAYADHFAAVHNLLGAARLYEPHPVPIPWHFVRSEWRRLCLKRLLPEQNRRDNVYCIAVERHVKDG